MTGDWWVWLFWFLLCYPIWSPRCRRWRREHNQPAIPERHRTGPKWEQDRPYPECFEEDDLDEW